MEVVNNSKANDFGGSRPSGGGGGDMGGPLIIGILGLGIAVLAFFVIVYALVLGLCAGAVYLGVKLGSAGESFGQNPRIRKHGALQLKRQKEKEYFESQDQDFMAEVVDNHFNDSSRKIYDGRDRLAEVGTLVKKVKDIFS